MHQSHVLFIVLVAFCVFSFRRQANELEQLLSVALKPISDEGFQDAVGIQCPSLCIDQPR